MLDCCMAVAPPNGLRAAAGAAGAAGAAAGAALAVAAACDTTRLAWRRRCSAAAPPAGRPPPAAPLRCAAWAAGGWSAAAAAAWPAGGRPGRGVEGGCVSNEAAQRHAQPAPCTPGTAAAKLTPCLHLRRHSRPRPVQRTPWQPAAAPCSARAAQPAAAPPGAPRCVWPPPPLRRAAGRCRCRHTAPQQTPRGWAPRRAGPTCRPQALRAVGGRVGGWMFGRRWPGGGCRGAALGAR